MWKWVSVKNVNEVGVAEPELFRSWSDVEMEHGQCNPEQARHSRMVAAAELAKISYPGPVGKLIAREIDACLSFAYMFDENKFVDELVDAVFCTPIPSDIPLDHRASAGAEASDDQRIT